MQQRWHANLAARQRSCQPRALGGENAIAPAGAADGDDWL